MACVCVWCVCVCVWGRGGGGGGGGGGGVRLEKDDAVLLGSGCCYSAHLCRFDFAERFLGLEALALGLEPLGDAPVMPTVVARVDWHDVCRVGVGEDRLHSTCKDIGFVRRCGERDAGLVGVLVPRLALRFPRLLSAGVQGAGEDSAPRCKDF